MSGGYIQNRIAAIIRAEYDKRPPGRYPSEHVLADAIVVQLGLVLNSGSLTDEELDRAGFQREYGELDDGHGNVWILCKPDCGLEIVRPGRVQCECDGPGSTPPPRGTTSGRPKRSDRCGTSPWTKNCWPHWTTRTSGCSSTPREGRCAPTASTPTCGGLRLSNRVWTPNPACTTCGTPIRRRGPVPDGLLRAARGCQRRIRANPGVSPPTLRPSDAYFAWLNGTANPTAEKVVSFARNIGRPPVEALVAAGYLAPDEAAEAIVARQSISEISDEILLAEMARRLAE